MWSDHTVLVVNGIFVPLVAHGGGTQRVCGGNLSWLRKGRRESCSLSPWCLCPAPASTWLLEGDLNNFWCFAIKQPQGERFSLFPTCCSCRASSVAKLRVPVCWWPGLPPGLRRKVQISLCCWTAECPHPLGAVVLLLLHHNVTLRVRAKEWRKLCPNVLG